MRLSEMLVQISEPAWAKTDARETKLVLPNWAMWKRIARPQAIGAVIGTVERRRARRRRHGGGVPVL